ncbi:hypothetical protein, partial [Endozoicomonas elysicola]|uniref:hypothetical protein n=1 Tax=Endozoicomonas elysicola TaxID=305900 RepID=UPI0013630D2D
VLRKELSGLLRTGADQLTDFLKATPYDTVKGMSQDLPLQGLGNGVEWLSELVTDLFNPDKDKARSRLTTVLTDRVVKAQDEVIDHVLRRLAGEGAQAGEGETGTKTPRDKLLDMVADQVKPLVAPAVSGAAVEVTRSTGQPVDPQALSKAIGPFLSEQLEQGKVFRRLAGYGVDQLTTWLSNDDHRNAIRKDVEKKVRALVVEVAEDLEDILDGHLATVRAAVKAGQKHHVDATKTLSRIAKKLDTEPDDGYGLVCGIEPLEPMEGLAEDGENVQAQDHWRQLCGAVVEQLGHGAGQLYDLTTGDVLDLRESGDREQAAGRLLLGKHIKAVIGEVVNEGVDFINQRNAAQRNAAQQRDGQETDQQAAEGITGLIEELPPLLTTPAVNRVCETLLSEAMKEQLVGQVKQAAGQVLTSDDKGKAPAATSAAGPSTQGAVAKPHTAVGSAVDPVLRKELSGLLRT